MSGVLGELAFAFLLVGLVSFGGGYAMIPLVERELIAGRGWLTTEMFGEIIAVAEMTPGPVAVNTATFVGHRLAGVAGGAAATLAVLAVPALVSGSLALALGRCGQIPQVIAALRGLRPVACAMLGAATLTIFRAVDLDIRSAAIAALAAVALYRRVHPLWVIAGAAGLGLLLF
ncbi:MAG: chromate transporter [Bacillota bacterium]|nr:chromate transporter [Bacillota bacterium]